jgi:hypothetical protein
VSKWLLMSVMVVPILLGLLPAKGRRRWRLSGVIGGVLAFDLFYLLVLYTLSYRWG